MSIRPYRKKWFVILGYPFNRMEFIRLCMFSFLCLSFLVGLVLYLYFDFITEDEAEKTLKEQHYESVESGHRFGQDPFELFMNKHLRETGFSKINSLQLIGSLSIGEEVFDFTLYSKRPNLCKVQLKWADGMACSGFDGASAWSFGSDSFVQQFALKAEILDSALSRFLATFLASEWSYAAPEKEIGRGKRSWLSWEAGVEWQGRDCDQLMNRSFGDGVIYHYFDRQKGLEISREARFSIGGAKLQHVMLYYSKPKESGYPLPSGFELWVDGRKLASAQFTHCEVNRGLMDYLFSCPEIPKEEERYAPLRLSGSTGY